MKQKGNMNSQNKNHHGVKMVFKTRKFDKEDKMVEEDLMDDFIA